MGSEECKLVLCLLGLLVLLFGELAPCQIGGLSEEFSFYRLVDVVTRRNVRILIASKGEELHAFVGIGDHR